MVALFQRNKTEPPIPLLWCNRGATAMDIIDTIYRMDKEVHNFESVSWRDYSSRLSKCLIFSKLTAVLLQIAWTQ